jgi:DNA-directed RNA polymerase specialized sigma24 family protein
VTQLIKAYGEQASVKELAQSFGIHRVTVTALLRRHRVELRLAGLGPEEIQAAARLHSEGWSLARLGEKFGVDPATVWRALRKPQTYEDKKRAEPATVTTDHRTAHRGGWPRAKLRTHCDNRREKYRL